MDDRIEKMLDHEKSSIRSIVIDHAVKIEFLISGTLSRVFGLSESSISFGNTSSALPFISKVNLLLDLKILLKEDREKLTGFAEIRNQFAHNFLIMEVKNCSEETLKKLRKWYAPKSDVSDIDDFESLYYLLYEDVKKSVQKLIDTLVEKAGEKGGDIGERNFNAILYEQCRIYSEGDIDFNNKLVALIKKATEIYNTNPLSDTDINKIPLI